MENVIRDIQLKLRQNRFPNEASISQGIVLRLVETLGWDVYDIDVVSPEFSTGTMRVDFALCHPPRKPVVLIEVKQPGTLNLSAEEQLSAYAYREGVPLVVLTSGQDWHFYAPYGPGQFSDRRIYRLDLLERTAAEAEERFRRYLSYGAWVNGQASLSVQEDLREMLSNQETRRKLPEAWGALLSEPNPDLVELLTAQLEKQTGSEPPKGEVVRFLKSKANQPMPPPRPQPQDRYHETPKIEVDSSIRLWIEGKEIPVINNRDRLTRVMNHLIGIDANLPAKYSHTHKPGQRPTFARSPVELFPKAQHLAKHKNNWVRVAGDEEWYLDLNKSASSMRSNIKKACDLAGVQFGVDVKIN